MMAYAVMAQGLPYRYFLTGIVIGGFALSLQVCIFTSDTLMETDQG